MASVIVIASADHAQCLTIVIAVMYQPFSMCCAKVEDRLLKVGLGKQTEDAVTLIFRVRKVDV